MDQKNVQPRKLEDPDLKPTTNSLSDGEANNKAKHPSQRLLRKVTVNLKECFDGIRMQPVPTTSTLTSDEEVAIEALLQLGNASNPSNVQLSDADEKYREEARLKFEVTLENLLTDSDPNSPYVEELAHLLRIYPYELIPQQVSDFLFVDCNLHKNLTTVLAPAK